jgi:hypothetical protein
MGINFCHWFMNLMDLLQWQIVEIALREKAITTPPMTTQ